jgi:hypothetical protein
MSMSAYHTFGYKWGTAAFGASGGQVTWSFAATAGQFFQFDAAITEAAFQNLIREAFAAWEAVANIDFVEVADSAASNIRLGWDAIDGKLNTLGEAYTTWNGNNTAIHGEIRFDTAETWSFSKDVHDASNFYALALHEIGHVLGLDHTDDIDTIMYPIIGHTVALSESEIAGAQSLYGGPAPVQAPELSREQMLPDVEVVAATYQFFTGSVPTEGGFLYLINSTDNATDLHDPYYAGFNTENRFINFANNLGSAGAGAAAFDAAFGGLTFEQAVALAYDEIVGVDNATAAGIDADAAMAFFESAYSFYEDVALERVVGSGVPLDDAIKLVMIGSMLNESLKADVGVYAEAVDEFATAYAQGQAVPYGADLMTA